MNETLLNNFKKLSVEELVNKRQELSHQLFYAIKIENMQEIMEQIEVIDFILASDNNE